MGAVLANIIKTIYRAILAANGKQIFSGNLKGEEIARIFQLACMACKLPRSGKQALALHLKNFWIGIIMCV